MKYDLFEIHGDMPLGARLWRIAVVGVIVLVCALDLFVWRPM